MFSCNIIHSYFVHSYKYIFIIVGVCFSPFYIYSILLKKLKLLLSNIDKTLKTMQLK